MLDLGFYSFVKLVVSLSTGLQTFILFFFFSFFFFPADVHGFYFCVSNCIIKSLTPNFIYELKVYDENYRVTNMSMNQHAYIELS